MEQSLVDDLTNYANNKGQHLLWKKKNVLSIRQCVVNNFKNNNLAKLVVDATSFLPVETSIELRVKAVIQGINAYGKCIACGNDAQISKNLSFKAPFFTKFCSSKSCKMSHMSKGRVTTKESRANHSISMSRYKRKLDATYQLIVDMFSNNDYSLLCYEDVVKYAQKCIAQRKTNGSLVPHHDLLENKDLVCSVLFYTKFVSIDLCKRGIKMLSLPERLYCLSHRLKQKPICKFCKTPMRFVDMKNGYPESCPNCIQEKIRETRGILTYAKCIDLIDKSRYEVIKAPTGRVDDKCHHLVVRCKRCGYVSKIALRCGNFAKLVKNQKLCKNCEKYSSKEEIELKNIVSHLVGSSNMHVNDRDLIHPYELDIAVPGCKVAIEFNGIYWHNDNVVKKNYHQLKTMKCEKKGYRLVHIFEDRWNCNKKLCIGILKRALNKSRVINAYDCIMAIGSATQQISKFMKRYSFNYSRCKESLFAQFFYKSHLVACVEIVVDDKQAYVKNIAQMNNIEVYKLVERACCWIDSIPIMLEVPHDFYIPEDFTCQGFEFKRYCKPNGRWFLCNKEKDFEKAKSNPKKHLKYYNPSMSFEQNLRANRWTLVYDSGTLVFEKKIV